MEQNLLILLKKESERIKKKGKSVEKLLSLLPNPLPEDLEVIIWSMFREFSPDLKNFLQEEQDSP